MVKKTAALILTATLLLSACGKQDTTPDTSKPSSESVTNSSNTTTPVDPTDQSDKSQASSDDSASTPPNEDTGSKTDEAASIPFKYHMNKVYDIVPNEEGMNKKVILLTFDDGPKKAEMINSLIDTLDKHHAKAVFFVNGYRVKSSPDLLKLIHDRGQIIGNHSWDHIILKDKPEKEVRKQIEDVQKIVKDTIGESPVFFRPPNGAGGDLGKKIAKENGMLYMTWSNGSLDWTMKSKDSNKPQKIVKNVMDQLHSGSNILMHELPWTVEALDTLLTTLESKGYSFVDPRSIEPEMR